MFVYYYAIVPLPLAAVETRLAETDAELEGWADEAYRHGEEWAGKLRVEGPAGAAKAVHFQLTPLTRTEKAVTLRMTWEATGTPGLFPQLDGDMTLSALDGNSTHISLRGTYRPPLGAVGKALDKVLLHRVAESSIKQFVDRIATSMSASGPPAESASNAH